MKSIWSERLRFEVWKLTYGVCKSSLHFGNLPKMIPGITLKVNKFLVPPPCVYYYLNTTLKAETYDDNVRCSEKGEGQQAINKKTQRFLLSSQAPAQPFFTSRIRVVR